MADTRAVALRRWAGKMGVTREIPRRMCIHGGKNGALGGSRDVGGALVRAVKDRWTNAPTHSQSDDERAFAPTKSFQSSDFYADDRWRGDGVNEQEEHESCATSFQAKLSPWGS